MGAFALLDVHCRHSISFILFAVLPKCDLECLDLGWGTISQGVLDPPNLPECDIFPGSPLSMTIDSTRRLQMLRYAIV